MNKLPKIDKPLFDLNIPSKKITVKSRPFLVKEEKILLLAQQSGNEKDMINAIKQIIVNCVVDDIDINKLATFDIEYMFLKLRARSVNNVVTVSYRDLNDGKTYDFTIDLDEVEMLDDKNISNRIMITDTVGMVMTYPSAELLTQVDNSSNQVDIFEFLCKSCIDSIFDADNVYLISDYSKEELDEFFDSLTIDTFEKIKTFFENLPKMYYKLDYKNSLGEDRIIELSSLSDFFILG